MNKTLGKTAETPYSPSQLSQMIKTHLESELLQFWLMGEVTEYYQAASGHQYFIIKDEKASLRCVFFNRNNRKRKTLAIGDQVLILGHATIYQQRGDLQINVIKISDQGAGLLALKYQQLKDRLESIGLFDASHKKAMPSDVSRIAIISSKDGAALQDILAVFKKKRSPITLSLYHSHVQGPQAAQMIIQQIMQAEKKQKYDLILLARGGGAVEDLWCFNDENLCMQIFNTATPLITAIGHQTDNSLADLTADLTFSTPTAAAEFIASQFFESINTFKHQQLRLTEVIKRHVEKKQQHIDLLTQKLERSHPLLQLSEQKSHSENLTQQLYFHIQNTFNRDKNRIRIAATLLYRHQPVDAHLKERIKGLQQKILGAALKAVESNKLRLNHQLTRLNDLNPLNVIAKGFSHTQLKESGNTVFTVKQLNKGDLLETQVNSGKIISRVEELFNK